MKFIKSKKGLALLATLVVAAAAAFGAYAYFTSTGSGTGSATVGTSTAWTVAQTSADNLAVGPLYPNPTVGTGTIQTNSYHVANPSTGQQSLAKVDISIALADGSPWSVDADGVGPLAACTKADFSVGGELVGVTHTDTSLAGNFAAAQDKTTGTVTIQMIDNSANQNSCKLATPPLYFSAS
jgi:hypothetical protein